MAENSNNNVGEYDVSKGMYVLHNGVEFATLEEVKAFKLGLEYAKGNANIGIDTVIENTSNSLKDMEL